MAEVVGLAASIIQIAGAGTKLSIALYNFANSAAKADYEVSNIADDVQLTTSALNGVGKVLEEEDAQSVIKKEAIVHANGIIKRCESVFDEIRLLIEKRQKAGQDGKGSLSALGKLAWPMKQQRVQLLKQKLESLKTSLLVLLGVLQLANLQTKGKLEKDELEKERENVRKAYQRQQESLQALQALESKLSKLAFDDAETLVGSNPVSRVPTISLQSVPIATQAKKNMQQEKQLGAQTSNLTDDSETSKSDDGITEDGDTSLTIDELAKCAKHVQKLLGKIVSLQQELEVAPSASRYPRKRMRNTYRRFCRKFDSVLFAQTPALTSPISMACALTPSSLSNSMASRSASSMPVSLPPPQARKDAKVPKKRAELHLCLVCRRSFKGRAGLKLHQRRAHDDPPVVRREPSPALFEDLDVDVRHGDLLFEYGSLGGVISEHENVNLEPGDDVEKISGQAERVEESEDTKMENYPHAKPSYPRAQASVIDPYSNPFHSPAAPDATSGYHYSEDQRGYQTKVLLHGDASFDEHPPSQARTSPLKSPSLVRSELESSTDKPGNKWPPMKPRYYRNRTKARMRKAIFNDNMTMRKPRPEPGFQEEKTGHVDGEKHELEAPQEKDIADKPDVNVDYEDSSIPAMTSSRGVPPYRASYSFNTTKDGYQSRQLTDSSDPGIGIILNDSDSKKRKQNFEAIQSDETPQKMTEFNMPPAPADFQPKLRVRSKTRDREKAERKRLLAREREDMACEQETGEQHKRQKKAQNSARLEPTLYYGSDVNVLNGFGYFTEDIGSFACLDRPQEAVAEAADRAEREKDQVEERQEKDIVDILLAQWTVPATQ